MEAVMIDCQKVQLICVASIIYKLFATIIVDTQNMQVICVASIMEAIVVDR